jgi:hypothetical protein
MDFMRHDSVSTKARKDYQAIEEVSRSASRMAYRHSDLVTQNIRGTDGSAKANVRIDIPIAKTAGGLSAGSGCG